MLVELATLYILSNINIQTNLRGESQYLFNFSSCDSSSLCCFTSVRKLWRLPLNCLSVILSSKRYSAALQRVLFVLAAVCVYRNRLEDSNYQNFCMLHFEEQFRGRCFIWRQSYCIVLIIKSYYLTSRNAKIWFRGHSRTP